MEEGDPAGRVVMPCLSNDAVAALIKRYMVNLHMKASCKKTFNSILNDKTNGLRNLLPSAHKSSYSLRRCRRFETPRWKTNRFRDTFLMKSCIEHNII